MYHILVIGAGYTGRTIGRFFVEKKQKVYGAGRSQATLEAVERDGMIPVCCDLTRPETLKELPPAHFIVISAAPDGRDEDHYRRLYLDGVRHALEAVHERPRPHLIVYLSSTGVWDTQEGWVDEQTPVEPQSTRSRILYQAERQVLTCGLPATVFRLSGIYGPGRNRLKALREGRVRPPEKDGWMNMIHVEDIARAMPVLFKSAEVGEVYCGVDDEPVRRSDFYRWMAESFGFELPWLAALSGSSQVQGKRIHNRRLRELGFEPAWPDYRAGYSAFAESGDA